MPVLDTNKSVNYVHALVSHTNNLVRDLDLSTIDNISIRADETGQKFCIMYLNKRTIGIIENLISASKFLLKYSSHISIYEQPGPAWRTPSLTASFHLLLKFYINKNLVYNLTYYYDEFGYIVGRETSSPHPSFNSIIHKVNCSEIYLEILKDVFKVQTVACKKFGPQILDPYPSISGNYTNICSFQILSKYFSLLKYHPTSDYISLFQQIFKKDKYHSKTYLHSILIQNIDFSCCSQFSQLLSGDIIYVQTLVALRLIDIFKQVHCNDPSIDAMQKEFTERLKAKLQDTINRTPSSTINLEDLIKFLNFNPSTSKSPDYIKYRLMS